MAAIIFGIAILAAVAGHPLTQIPVIGTIMYPVILISCIICGLKRYS